jgi:hypothetical protein
VKSTEGDGHERIRFAADAEIPSGTGKVRLNKTPLEMALAYDAPYNVFPNEIKATVGLAPLVPLVN